MLGALWNMFLNAHQFPVSNIDTHSSPSTFSCIEAFNEHDTYNSYGYTNSLSKRKRKYDLYNYYSTELFGMGYKTAT